MESKDRSDEVLDLRINENSGENEFKTSTSEVNSKIHSDDENERNDEDDETEHVILDVSSSRGGTVISIQPHLKDPEEHRRVLPITIGRLDGRHSQVVPLNGLQLLYDVTRLRIHQTYDIHHLTSGLTSENRYILRCGDDDQEGDAIYGCCETSASWQRLLCGASRRLHLTLMDQTHQEAATFHRRLAFSFPFFGIYLQRMDVYLPGGEYLGTVAQEWSPGYPNFSVRNANCETLYKIRANNCWTCTQTDFVFYILNSEDTEVLAHISHEWDRNLVDYNLSVVMPPTQSVKSKALIVAAAFLLEYMYFLPSKEGRILASCCK